MAGKVPGVWGGIHLFGTPPGMPELSGQNPEGKADPGTTQDICKPGTFTPKKKKGAPSGYFLDRLPGVIEKFLKDPNSLAAKGMRAWLAAGAYTVNRSQNVDKIDRCFIGVDIKTVRGWKETTEAKPGTMPGFAMKWNDPGHPDRKTAVAVICAGAKEFLKNNPGAQTYSFPSPPFPANPANGIPDYSTNVKDWAHRLELWRIGGAGDGSKIPPLDDMGILLGKYNWGYTLQGTVFLQNPKKARVDVNGVLLYMYDCYDFEGFQPLGIWNAEPGKEDISRVSLKPWPFNPETIDDDPQFYPGMGDTVVNNQSFRRFREITCRGGDMLILSDLEVLKAAASFSVDVDAEKEVP